MTELQAVEREVDELRMRTQTLLEELERRVREGVDKAKGTVERVKYAVDVPARVKELPRVIKRHPAAASGVGLAIAGVIGATVWIAIARARARRSTWGRVRHRAIGYGRILQDPHRVLRRREPIWRRVLIGVLVTAATTVVKSMLTDALKRVAEEHERPLLGPSTQPAV